MKLYLISQDQNDDYDTYNSAVVAAPDEQTAKNINPGGGSVFINWKSKNYGWCRGVEHVHVEYIGEAAPDVELGVVLASFKAG